MGANNFYCRYIHNFTAYSSAPLTDIIKEYTLEVDHQGRGMFPRIEEENFLLQLSWCASPSGGDRTDH